MIKYITLFSISVVLSLLITPFVRLLAEKLSILDLPSGRKVHETPVPLLGGIPIFIALNLTYLLGHFFYSEYFTNFFSPIWKPILISQCIILGIGVFDDIKKASPWIKLLFQLISGFLLIIFGFGIEFITNPFTGESISLGVFSIPLTILWIVGITNALNLIDGLDGLAAGTSFIVCITIFGISFIYQNISVALVSVILAGSILGFLKYNFYPAKIFLGDSGSLLLGFLLGVLSLQGVHKGATMVAVLAPILALGFPILDTILSIIRRSLRSMLSIEDSEDKEKTKILFFKNLPLFQADKDHIHHRLLKIGLSHKKSVIVLYGICLMFCVFSILTVAWKNVNIALFLGAIIIASLVGIKSLNYKEFKVFERGLFLPLFNAPLISKRFFQAIIDLLFISVSYYLSLILVFQGFRETQAKPLFIQFISVVLAIKIIVFCISGFYKGSWRYSSIEDLIKIVRAVVISSAISFLTLASIVGMKTFGGLIFFVLDFYFLLSLVAGSRVSFLAIDYYYHKQKLKEGKKVIIYGAGRGGSILAKELQYNPEFQCDLIGFIDDDPQKKGKTQYDFPILGGLEEIDDIINKTNPSEIIISSYKIGNDKINLLKQICSPRGISLQLFELHTKTIK